MDQAGDGCVPGLSSMLHDRMGNGGDTWYQDPSEFDDLRNTDVRRILTYLFTTRAAGAARRMLADQRFPGATPELVENLQLKAAENVSRYYDAVKMDEESCLFVNEDHARRTGNKFLRTLVFHTRDRGQKVREEPYEDTSPLFETQPLEQASEDFARMLGRMAQETDFAQVRLEITALAGSDRIICSHAGSAPCYHAKRSCPQAEVVLSTALQLVAYFEGVAPPIRDADMVFRTQELGPLAKYGMLETADPFTFATGAGVATPAQRKNAERRWHCAVNLVAAALGNREVRI